MARVTCPACGGRRRIDRTIPGVPPDVCMASVSCQTCWPRNADGSLKLVDDGTAGTIESSAGSGGASGGGGAVVRGPIQEETLFGVAEEYPHVLLLRTLTADDHTATYLIRIGGSLVWQRMADAVTLPEVWGEYDRRVENELAADVQADGKRTTRRMVAAYRAGIARGRSGG